MVLPLGVTQPVLAVLENRAGTFCAQVGPPVTRLCKLARWHIQIQN